MAAATVRSASGATVRLESASAVVKSSASVFQSSAVVNRCSPRTRPRATNSFGSSSTARTCLATNSGSTPFPMVRMRVSRNRVRSVKLLTEASSTSFAAFSASAVTRTWSVGVSGLTSFAASSSENPSLSARSPQAERSSSRGRNAPFSARVSRAASSAAFALESPFATSAETISFRRDENPAHTSAAT